MAWIRRQVDLILQNHTVELLTIEGAMAVQGTWNTSGPPKIGGVISKQNAAKWSNISNQDGMTAEAFLRLGSTKGYIGIHWILPRSADEFTLQVETPPLIEHNWRDTGPNFDFRVVVLTLYPTRSTQWSTEEMKIAEEKR
jgi:hypothetical protein